MLQKSPIARLAVVEKRATKTYPNGLVPRGQALKDLVKEWLEEVESVAGDGRLRILSCSQRKVKEQWKPVGSWEYLLPMSAVPIKNS